MDIHRNRSRGFGRRRRRGQRHGCHHGRRRVRRCVNA
jgi:hypothetical protein